MRRARAWLLSVAAHAALLACAWLATRPAAGPSLPPAVEAVIGNVFVSENETPRASGAASPAAKANEEEAPGETLEGGERAGGGSPGLPDGEASPLGRIEPSYPPLSRKLGEEGEAAFLLRISAEGAVLGARLEKSSGYERLDEAARAALLAAAFRPAEKDGRAVPSEKRLRVEFRLERR